MSISLRETVGEDLEGEVHGHDYRLRKSQFQRAIKAGIIPKADGVELRDGFLRLRPIPGDSDSGGDYRLSLDQYRAMARQGILTKDDRIELLDGWLVAKMSKNQPHSVAKRLAFTAIQAILPPGWLLGIEDPVTAVGSEPEPDLSIFEGVLHEVPDQAPGPRQVVLSIEVANSSLSRDRGAKKRLYAESGFATYWLINLVNRRIEVYTDPTGPVENPDYLTRQDFGPDDMIPVVIEGREVGLLAVRDLLP